VQYRNFLRDGKGIHTQLMQVVNLCKILDRELYNYLGASGCFLPFVCCCFCQTPRAELVFLSRWRW
jgi:hypothetical protein